VLRVRPKAMTVAVIIAGLLPILWGTGAGSEVMSRIAAPMIGGMITAPLLSLFIIPAAYKLMWLSRHRGKRSDSPPRLRRSGKLAIVAPFFWPA
jgi:Cu(I)/Ag(I) efflux system membrane protein CusA/SilA